MTATLQSITHTGNPLSSTEGNTVYFKGQTVVFDYFGYGLTTSPNYSSTVYLAVYKPDGTVDILDGQDQLAGYTTTDALWGATHNCWNTGGIYGTCEYKLEEAGTYVFWVGFLQNTQATKEALISNLEAAISQSKSHWYLRGEPLVITCSDSASYEDKFAYTITHEVYSASINAESLQWQESTNGGSTWTDIEDATEETLILGTWTGAVADDEAAAIENAIAAIPAYERYIRCVAKGLVEDTISDVMHIVYEEGHGTPEVR